MPPLDLLVLSLFAWYAAYCLVKTDGPFKVFSRLRGMTTLGGLLTCPWCLVVWIAMIGYIIYYHTPLQAIIYIGAVSGGAMFIHKHTGSDYA